MQNINLPTTLIIFGATGDLSTKKLIPSLYNLDRQGLLPEKFKILAFARKKLSIEQYRKYIEKEVVELYPNLIEDSTWNRFFRKIEYKSGDFNDKAFFAGLYTNLSKVDQELGTCTHKLFYLAVSPDLYEQILTGIKNSDVLEICKNKSDSRLIIEKPFGKDLKSFNKLNNLVLDIFTEKQIYRIDHFLGKETVQNLLYFRAANPIFSNDWKNHTITKIYVRVFESIGIEQRASYYDRYGQLRDMVQSHLLQLLALILMDMPSALDDMSDISKKKASLIERVVVKDKRNDVVRGQYMEGVVNAEQVKGYREEEGIKLSSNTETFVKIKAMLDKKGWEDTEIVLVTGKRMQKKQTEIEIVFNHGGAVGDIHGKNRIIFRIQPEEGISLFFNAKKPGENELDSVEMKFLYKEGFEKILPEAYESILSDIIKVDKSNFLTTKELEASWKFVDNIIHYWKEHHNLKYYPAGTNQLV